MTNKGVPRWVLSLLLVVGLATVAVVAVVHITNSSKSGSSVSLSRQMKLVTVPGPALSPVAQDSKTQIKDNLKAALLVAINQTNKAMKITESLSLDTTTSEYIRHCLEQCKPMFMESIESAQDTLSEVTNADMNNMNDNSLYNLVIRINGVSTYTETCVDSMTGYIDNLSGIPPDHPIPPRDVEVFKIVYTQIRQVSSSINTALGIVRNNMKEPYN